MALSLLALVAAGALRPGCGVVAEGRVTTSAKLSDALISLWPTRFASTSAAKKAVRRRLVILGNDDAEDDGVVLSMGTDPDGGSSLYVLDASDMRLVARCRSPVALPAGFHGEWVSRETEAQQQ